MGCKNGKDSFPSEEIKRLSLFVIEQEKHWKRLKRGIVPDNKIINGWIESCQFALEDLGTLQCRELEKT